MISSHDLLNGPDVAKAVHSGQPPQHFKVFALLLILCAVIAYIPAIGAGFVWDDDLLLTANPQMESGQGLKDIWLGKTVDYQPLTFTILWLEKAVWGDGPAGYHVISILLHAVAAVLLWRTLSILRIPGSWLAALLFVIHPVNVASVAWIAELKNTLSAAFFFGSILAFLSSLKWNDTKLYLLSIALFALAGLSKGAVVIMPVVLCGCLGWTNKKIKREDLARITPFVFIAIVISLLTIRYQSSALDYGLASSSLPLRSARAGMILWLYLREIFFPINLNPMLAQWQPNLHSALVYLPHLLVVAVLGVFFWKRHSWGRPFLFASSYYLWMLLPVLGLVWMALQQETPCADWWQYLAAPGIFAGIAGGFIKVSRGASRDARRRLYVLACVVLAVLTVQTWRRCTIYQSMETYCRAVLAENPHVWALQTNLGVMLAQRGEFEQAIACHRQALRDNPRFMQAHNNLGNALGATRHWREAEAEFLSALQLSPSNAVVLGNLSENYFREGETGDALVADANAIKADRYNPLRYVEFGVKLAVNKQFEQAVVCFKNASLLNPRDIVTQIKLAQALMAAGHGEDAFVASEQAMRSARQSGDKELIRMIGSLWDNLPRRVQE
jgi:tetratricopeptide (TPR) repeat protein